MKNEILRLLRRNGRLSFEEIAVQLDIPAETVRTVVSEMEESGVISGYQAVIDDSLLPETKVKAIIEVNIRPQRDGGFDKIALRIAKFSEVDSMYLISGGYDLELEVRGDSLQAIAAFVSGKLATIDGVTSTATRFILKKYKEAGRIFDHDEEYKRLKVTP
ncbi:MAG: Lrp/AsnC family transcriptional regulator [Kiritimatiellaeota bacterium]|nr:Lrp/AsnC family transcriptional regulator [Kiritimatiellota bacterium]